MIMAIVDRLTAGGIGLWNRGVVYGPRPVHDDTCDDDNDDGNDGVDDDAYDDDDEEDDDDDDDDGDGDDRDDDRDDELDWFEYSHKQNMIKCYIIRFHLEALIFGPYLGLCRKYLFLPVRIRLALYYIWVPI